MVLGTGGLISSRYVPTFPSEFLCIMANGNNRIPPRKWSRTNRWRIPEPRGAMISRTARRRTGTAACLTTNSRSSARARLCGGRPSGATRRIRLDAPSRRMLRSTMMLRRCVRGTVGCGCKKSFGVYFGDSCITFGSFSGHRLFGCLRDIYIGVCKMNRCDMTCKGKLEGDESFANWVGWHESDFS